MSPAALPALEELAPLCRAVAARFCRPGGADFDDFCQEALIGAWQGLHAYDPAKSPDPRKFALACARREVMNALTVRRRRREECVLDAPVRDQDGEDLTVADCVPGWSPDPADAAAARETLAAILGRLSGAERTAVLMRFCGFTLAEIGRALGRGPKAADNALARARRKASAMRLRGWL